MASRQMTRLIHRPDSSTEMLRHFVHPHQDDRDTQLAMSRAYHERHYQFVHTRHGIHDEGVRIDKNPQVPGKLGGHIGR